MIKCIATRLTVTGICEEWTRLVALGKDGRIYEWGDLDGLPTVPEILLGDLADKKVVQIACGQSHSLCLTSEGQVYSWGANGQGQLGLGQGTRDQKEPMLVSGFDVKIKAIDCAAHNSFAVDVNGGVSFLHFCI